MNSLLLAAATTAPAHILKGAAAATAAPKQLHLTPQQIQQLMQQQAAQQQVLVPHTWFQDHASWLTHSFAGLFIVAAIGLVVLLALQTTKQEGLSGTIGGRVESSYGRMGAEDQLKRITGVVAVGFVILGTILSLTGI
ncbi:MAG TPA: preprotein translocase subunit SecG [Candidatus Baltobacteraceae bacterium]